VRLLLVLALLAAVAAGNAEADDGIGAIGIYLGK
jgi:hypothetical protein